MTQHHSTLWVCEDCYVAHEEVLEDGTVTDREPLGLISDDAEVTAGLIWEEHAEDCPNRHAGEWIEDCDCERRTFSWSACQGCGSTLGGAREALTIWWEA